MKFHKAAMAAALMLALTGCNGSETSSSDPAPQADETISMGTACIEIAPLIKKFTDVAGTAAANNVSPDDPDTLNELKSILDEIDGIGAKIETEEGVAVMQELTNGFDQAIEAFQKEGVWKLDETPSANVAKKSLQAMDDYMAACGFSSGEN